MANATADYGLVPYKNLNGAGFSYIEAVALAAYSTDLFVGDPVILGGDGLLSKPSVVIAVGSAGTESTNIFGVITGFTSAGPDSLNTLYGAADTARTVQIVPALPGTLFRVNASNTTGVNPADLGNGFDLVAGSGDTLTGRSGWALDVGEDNNAGATTGRQCRLVGFDNRPDNAIGASGTDTANVDCIVTFAESFWHTGGAGVA